MKTANIIVKVDPKVKKKVQRLAAEAGLTLSDLLNSSLHEYARAETVTVVGRPAVRPEKLALWKRINDDAERGIGVSGPFATIGELRAHWKKLRKTALKRGTRTYV
jgi:hypothetical protein